MRRLKVEYQQEAISDLGEIYRYISLKNQDGTTAREFVKRIKWRCSRIGLVPFGGRPRNDLEDGLRMLSFEHAVVIVYKVEQNCVRITNIFYGGRDYEAFYLGTPAEDEETQSDE